MSRIFLPVRLGRGLSVSRANVQDTYDALKTMLNSTKLSDENFAPDAGIPEALLNWDHDMGHDHRDGSLGYAVIDDTMIEVSGAYQTQWIMAQETGARMIVGITPGFDLRMVDEREEDLGRPITVVFGQGSDNPAIFAPGTTPVVQIQLYDFGDTNINYTTNTAPESQGKINAYANFRIVLEDITSNYFTFRYFSNFVVDREWGDTPISTPPAGEFRVFYMATGVAPGYLINPAGVL